MHSLVPTEEDADVFVKSCFAEFEREALCTQQPDQESNTESSTFFGSSPDLQSASGSTCPETVANAYESPVSQLQHDIARYGVTVKADLKLETVLSSSRLQASLVRSVQGVQATHTHMFVPVDQAHTGRPPLASGSKPLNLNYRGLGTGGEQTLDRPFCPVPHNIAHHMRQQLKGLKTEMQLDSQFPQPAVQQAYANMVMKRVSVGPGGNAPNLGYEPERSGSPAGDRQNASGCHYANSEHYHGPEYAETPVDVVQARIRHAQRSCQSPPTCPQTAGEFRQHGLLSDGGAEQGRCRPATPCTPRASSFPTKPPTGTPRACVGNTGRNSPLAGQLDMASSPQQMASRDARSPSTAQSPVPGRVESPIHGVGSKASVLRASAKGPAGNSVDMDYSCSRDDISMCEVEDDLQGDSTHLHISTTSFACSRDIANEACGYEGAMDACESPRVRITGQRSISKEVLKQMYERSLVSSEQTAMYHSLSNRDGEHMQRQSNSDVQKVLQRSKLSKTATNYMLKSYGSDSVLPLPSLPSQAARHAASRGHYRHQSMSAFEPEAGEWGNAVPGLAGDPDAGTDNLLGAFLEDSMLMEGDGLDNTLLEGLVDFDDTTDFLTAGSDAQRKRMVSNLQPKYIKRAKITQVPHGGLYETQSGGVPQVAASRPHHMQLHRALSTGALEIHRARAQMSYREHNTEQVAPSSPSVRTCSSAGKNKSREATPTPVREFNNRAKPSFSDLVNLGLIAPGEYEFTVGNIPGVVVNVMPAGAIQFNNKDYNSISSFALAALKSRNPSRQACDGWKEVRWKGQRLEVMRQRCMKLLAQEGRSHKGGYL